MSPRVRPDPALQHARELYQERMLRRLYVRHPGWDAGWQGDPALRKADGSVCHVLGYRLPDVVPDSEIERHAVAPIAADDTLMHGLCRLQVARRDPRRQQQIFGWRTPPADDAQGWRAFERTKEEYWTRILAEPYEQMHVLKDTADFKANYLLRLLYLHGETTPALRSIRATWRQDGDFGRDVNFSATVEGRFHERFLHFKYWLDEPFAVHDPARPRDAAAIRAARQALVDIPDAPRFSADDVSAEMTYWSENHTVLFGTAEYLAGQRWPDDVFRAGALFRAEGPDAVRDGDLTGAQHVVRAGARLRRWLDDRLRFGFSEWNAPGYYEEDFGALFNLADFALDEDIAVRACMVLDLMLFDVARLSHRGSFGLTAGRAYVEHKICGYDQTPGDLAQVIFGQRGTYVDGNSESAGCYASSTGYAVPPVLVAIASDHPRTMLDRRRVSVDIDEAELHGIGTRTEDDVLTWWTRGAYFVKQLAMGTEMVARTRFLSKTSPFRDILPMLEVVAVARGADPVLATTNAAAGSSGVSGAGDDLSVFTEGSALTQARLTTWRTRNTMLSSVRRFHPHQLNFQSQYAQATLGMGATVWTTHPSAGSTISPAAAISGGILGGAAAGAAIGSFFGPIGTAIGGIVGGVAGGIGAGEAAPEGIELFPATDNGPNWWTGSVTVPMTAQHEGAVILAYSPRAIQSVMFGHRTHAWFPRPAFDPGSVVQHFATDTNMPGSTWTFGKSGDGYVALWSARSVNWTTDGPWADRELIADGDGNVFIIQVGEREDFGSYQSFMDRVRAARIHISDLGDAEVECSYDVPGGQRLELHGERDEVRYGGRVAGDRFPRWESPYVQGGRVGNRTYRYTVAFSDRSLHHDFNDIKTRGHAGSRVREIDGPRHDQRDTAFLVIADRGAAGDYPENTLAACRHAVAIQRANAVCVDACLTADGVLALWRDADPDDLDAVLRRTGLVDVRAFRPSAPDPSSPWRRRVGSLSLEELQQHYGYVDANGVASGEPIPGLTELLAKVGSFSGLLHVVIRLRLDATTSPSQATAYLRAIRAAQPAGAPVDATVLIPDLSLLQAMLHASDANDPRLCWERGPDDTPPGIPAGAVDSAAALGTTVALVIRRPDEGIVGFLAAVDAETHRWDAFNFNYARNHGAQIERLLCPSVNDPAEMAWVVAQEVSGALTDNAPALLELVKRAGLPTN